jgi:hypothetical protein
MVKSRKKTPVQQTIETELMISSLGEPYQRDVRVAGESAIALMCIVTVQGVLIRELRKKQGTARLTR